MASLEEIYQEQAVVGDPTSTANCLAVRLGLDMEQTAVLTPLLRQYCMGRERGRVRAVERQVLPTGSLSTGDYRDLLREFFFVPGYGRVAWGEATVVHHEARIAMLSMQRAGIDSTIARHRWAIEQITAHEAVCLNDLGGH